MRLFDAAWTNPDEGADRFTFPSDDPRTEIDYLLFRGADRMVAHDVLGEPVVSDHQPLFVELELRD